MSDILKELGKTTDVTCELYGIESMLQHYGIIRAGEEGNAPMLRYVRSGRGDPKEALKFFIDMFGPGISHQENEQDDMHLFSTPDTYVSLQINKINITKDTICHIELDFVTTDQKTFDKVKEWAKELLQSTPSSNSVLALTNTPNGLALSQLGEFDQKLLTCNYDSKVIKGYEHVKACLATKSPCGRLVLFQGAPGTGKSYMIRSLVSSADSTFIIVGSNMIADLSGPSILPVLLNLAKIDGKPITFILEDADVALSDRKAAAGMSQLSGLLNLGDGLLGELLDIRIVATTNAGTLELDKAITRPGRMCQHIEFNDLSAEDSNSLYSKLVGETDTILKRPQTLAEVYRMAREDGWEPPKEEENKSGQYL